MSGSLYIAGGRRLCAMLRILRGGRPLTLLGLSFTNPFTGTWHSFGLRVWGDRHLHRRLHHMTIPAGRA